MHAILGTCMYSLFCVLWTNRRSLSIFWRKVAGMRQNEYLCGELLNPLIPLLRDPRMKRLPIFLFLSLLLSVQLRAATPVTFNPDTRYSREVIDACLYHFQANTTAAGFAQHDASGNKVKDSESKRGFDYVPGLVAKAVLEAICYYQDSAFAAPWYYSMAAYGDKYAANDHSTSKTLDDLNACKLYFGLADLSKPGAKFANSTTYANCNTAKNSALKGLENYNTQYAISSATSQAFCGDDTYAGGWWHKSSYANEMWCDGQYMGPALLAQLIADGRLLSGYTADQCWDLIAKQFTMTWGKLWDADKRLLYHAFSAAPASDAVWADQDKTSSHYGVSAEYWGRAEGWYFLALIDVLELMPKSHPQYAVLRGYLNQVADGLIARQDAATGCWCQLLQYANGVTPAGCSKANYLEASGSALFVAGLLKGQRLGLFDTDYSAAAKKGYRGLIERFLVTSAGDGNRYALINSCASAGLGGKDNRKGDANYYLSGEDTKVITTYTEGKILGAFVLAAVEYERAYMTPQSRICQCSYTADNTTNFANPERGFYQQVEYGHPYYSKLSKSSGCFQKGREAGRSLILRLYYLHHYRNQSTLPDSLITMINNDMEAIRQNGFKCILRFAYTSEASETPSKNLDASPAIWQAHLSQLKPVMAANADVIYVVQAGFLGAWGEWYYSGQGIGNSIAAATKKNLITQLLDAVPANRCVQLRTPLFKTDYMGDAVALTAATAYKGDARSRLGHHNDAFCNGEYNMGTYTNVSSDKAYIAQECLFVPIGGETNIGESNAANYTNYGTGEKAEAEMRLLHYSYLNYSYSKYATEQWKKEKDASGTSYYDLMARQMGYRLVLTEGSFPTEAAQGDKMAITLKISNTGYAPLYNERHAYIVLKNANKTYRVPLQSDPRTWQPTQTTTVSESLSLPTDIEAGTYSLYLYLPDADSKIADNPAYAVRFANSDVWDAATGYNSLNTQVVITEAANGGNEDNNDDAQSCNCLKFSLVQNTARSAK